MEKNLWKVVSGEETKPTQRSKLIEWKNKGSSVKTLLGLGLSDIQIPRLDMKKCSKEVWKSPDKLLGNIAKGAKLLLKRILVSLKRPNYDSITDHVIKLRTLLPQLA